MYYQDSRIKKSRVIQTGPAGPVFCLLVKNGSIQGGAADAAQ